MNGTSLSFRQQMTETYSGQHQVFLSLNHMTQRRYILSIDEPP